jgi:hypothetical protein
VHAAGGDGKLACHGAPGPRQDVEGVLASEPCRILRHLARRGIVAPVVTTGDGEVLAGAGADDDDLSRKRGDAKSPQALVRTGLEPGELVRRHRDATKHR